MATTKVIGLDKLRRKMIALPKAIEAEIRKAMETGAEEMVAMARRLAPVDDGDLRESIGWTWGEAPKGSMVIAKGGSTGMTITVYAGNSEAFYARWVEFGTVTHPQGGKFGGTRHPGTTAQPFFFPAWRATRKRVKSRTSRAVSKAAKRIAAGGN